MSDSRKWLTSRVSAPTSRSPSVAAAAPPVLKYANRHRSSSKSRHSVPTAHVAPHTVSTGVSTASIETLEGTSSTSLVERPPSGRNASNPRLNRLSEPMYRPQSSPVLHRSSFGFDSYSLDRSGGLRESASAYAFDSGMVSAASSFRARVFSEEDIYAREELTRHEERIDFMENKLRELEHRMVEQRNSRASSSLANDEMNASVTALREQFTSIVQDRNTEIRRLQGKLRKSKRALEENRLVYRQECDKMRSELILREEELDDLRSRYADAQADRSLTPIIAKVESLPNFLSYQRQNSGDGETPSLLSAATSQSSLLSAKESDETLRMYRDKYRHRIKSLIAQLEEQTMKSEALNAALDLQNSELSNLRKRVQQMAELGDSQSKLGDLLTKGRAELAECAFAVRCLTQVCQQVGSGQTPNLNSILGVRSVSASESEDDSPIKQNTSVIHEAEVLVAKLRLLRRDLDNLQKMTQNEFAQAICDQIQCPVQ